MERVEAFGVKDCKADKSGTSDERTENRKGSEYVFTFPRHRRKPVVWRHTNNTREKRYPTHLPSCLNQRSVTRHRKNPTPVMEHPMMKRGFRMSAAMSEMYGIVPFVVVY